MPDMTDRYLSKIAAILDLTGYDTKVRHVRDAAFWGKPVGTPIVPGMKPHPIDKPGGGRGKIRVSLTGTTPHSVERPRAARRPSLGASARARQNMLNNNVMQARINVAINDDLKPGSGKMLKELADTLRKMEGDGASEDDLIKRLHRDGERLWLQMTRDRTSSGTKEETAQILRDLETGYKDRKKGIAPKPRAARVAAPKASKKPSSGTPELRRATLHYNGTKVKIKTNPDGTPDAPSSIQTLMTSLRRAVEHAAWLDQLNRATEGFTSNKEVAAAQKRLSDIVKMSEWFIDKHGTPADLKRLRQIQSDGPIGPPRRMTY